jgi:hypothetical protein
VHESIVKSEVAGRPHEPGGGRDHEDRAQHGPTFVTLRPWKRALSASDSRPTPRRTKSDFL